MDEVSRRKFLLGLAASSGLVLAGCARLPGMLPGFLPRHGGQPGDRPDPRRPEGVDLLPQIEHIVIYMQENHSYDSYFGMHPRGDGYHVHAGVPLNSNPDTGRQRRARVPRAGGVPTRSRSVAVVDVDAPADRRRPHGRLPVRRQHQRHEVLGRIGSAVLLVAREHVPDLRPLVRVGTRADVSEPHVPAGRHLAGPRRRPTSPRRSRCRTRPAARSGRSSSAHGISWLDYAWDLPDILLFPKVWNANKDKVRTFDQFLGDCRTGALPSVSIVSPGVAAYTEENPADVQLGEAYSSSIINAVMASPAWPKTALLFMYDEHGGYYDHVRPPAAVPPDDIPPGVDPAPGAPAAWNIYGLRVPAFVISPFAQAQLRVARRARPHVRAALHRDEVQPRRADRAAMPTRRTSSTASTSGARPRSSNRPRWPHPACPRRGARARPRSRRRRRNPRRSRRLPPRRSPASAPQRSARDVRDEPEKADPDDQRIALLQLAGAGSPRRGRDRARSATDAPDCRHDLGDDTRSARSSWPACTSVCSASPKRTARRSRCRSGTGTNPVATRGSSPLRTRARSCPRRDVTVQPLRRPRPYLYVTVTGDVVETRPVTDADRRTLATATSAPRSATCISSDA